jgi:hypothetical protein
MVKRQHVICLQISVVVDGFWRNSISMDRGGIGLQKATGDVVDHYGQL